MYEMNQNKSNRKTQELESIKHKLQKVSKTSKSSKMNVDDYISNIIGSGLDVPNKTNNKFVSRSAQNVLRNSSNTPGGHYLTNSFNSLNPSHASKSSAIHKDFFSSLPIDYQNLIDKIQQPNGDLDTQKIYEIFRTSGLTNEILGHIWNSVNRTCAGQLTSLEFAVGLAMIALYQRKSINLCGSYRNYQNLDLIAKWDEIMLTGDFKMPILDCEYLNSFEQSSANIKDQTTIGFSNGDTKTHHIKSLDEMTAEQFNEACFSMATNVSMNNNSNGKTNQLDCINDDDDWADFSSFSGMELNKNGLDIKDHSKTLHGQLLEETQPKLDIGIDNDFGDFQNFSQHSANQFPQFEQVTPKDNDNNNNSDKYKVFQEDADKSDVTLVDQWLLCLNCCLQIISDIVSVLNNIEDDASEIRKEIFQTDKGTNLLSGLIEVYLVTKNIKLSASKLNLLANSESMLRVLAEVETNWNQFMMIIPTNIQKLVSEILETEVHNKLSQKSSRTVTITTNPAPATCSVTNELCGVCLSSLNTETGFLSHGSHKYHCPCANLWVNNLNLTLPGLIDLIPATNVEHIF